MSNRPNEHGRKRGRGLRPWLVQLKCLGLMGFLGGLAALSAIGLFGPEPADAEQWAMLRSVMRAIFWPCVLGGLLVTIAAGILLWLAHPRVFMRTRWFRLKLALLLVLLPTLHITARGRVLDLYAAIDEGRLDALPGLHAAVTQAFLVALVVMLAVASIGRFKPRLGERFGSRREGAG